MHKSEFAVAVDEIQKQLANSLRRAGFKAKGRAFNRTTTDGLTQVIGIQMGASDPPGTTYIPGLRENLHGRFTVNLGVYVPEVDCGIDKSLPAWIQEHSCCIRSRLGRLIGEGKDMWWLAQVQPEVVQDILNCLEQTGIPFLEQFASRDKILSAWSSGEPINIGGHPPRIIRAIILAKRGQAEEAKQLLRLQIETSTRNPGHPAYVRSLAASLGLGSLEESPASG